MRTGLMVAIVTVVTFAGVVVPGIPAAPTPASQPSECRLQSAGEKPSATTDDIVNCVVEQQSPTRVRINVTYTYASPLGNQNIWMGLDVLAGGNRLKWFNYRVVPITRSSGTASFEIAFGQSNPPAGKLSTDQVEFFMYVGGGQIFYRKTYSFKHDWQL